MPSPASPGLGNRRAAPPLAGWPEPTRTGLILQRAPPAGHRSLGRQRGLAPHLSPRRAPGGRESEGLREWLCPPLRVA